MNDIKDKIYYLRNKWGMTQVEFADKIHISGSMVSIWERGKAIPTRENAYRIAKAFDTSVEWLLRKEEPEQEEPEQEEKVFTKDEIVQQFNPTIDEANPVGALFSLLGKYMKINDVLDNDGETQIIATVKGEVADIVSGTMYMQKGVESGYLDQEMMNVWKKKKLNEYGMEAEK